MKRRAFTVIELLVVLAIIGVLVALGAGVVFQIQERSRSKLEKIQWHKSRLIGESTPRSDPVKLLFIGNSYTQQNDLPAMISALAESAGNSPPIVYDKQLVGGYTLEQHWNDGVALDKIRQGGWEFVVLQEQSWRPIADKPAMTNYARKFDQAINDQGGITLFYLTWTRAHLPQMQTNLNSAYLRLAEQLRAEVAPAGMAWRLALDNDPGLVLHESDQSHPNPTGTYLAACAFFGAIFTRSPEGLTNRIEHNGTVLVDLPQDQARFLQQTAWKAVINAKKRLRPEIWRAARAD